MQPQHYAAFIWFSWGKYKVHSNKERLNCWWNHIYVRGVHRALAVYFAVEKWSFPVFDGHTCIQTLQQRGIYCTRSQFVGLSSLGRLWLVCTLLAYLPGHILAPSLQSPRGTRAAESPAVLVGHQNHPEGERNRIIISVWRQPQNIMEFISMAVEEVISMMTVMLVWHFLSRYCTKSWEHYKNLPRMHIVPSGSVRRRRARCPGSFSCPVDCHSSQSLCPLGSLPDRLCRSSPLPPSTFGLD